MKKVFKKIIFLSFSVVLFACGDNGKKISEVKLIPVKSGSDYQYIDREGKIVINPQFRTATVFRDELALIETSGKDSKWGFISEDGTFAIPATYISATVFSEGLAWVISKNGAPTAINTSGEAQFTLKEAEEVRIFKEGLAAFSRLDNSRYKWGFVDKSGIVKINPQYSKLSNFSDGMCAVRSEEGKWGFIDPNGQLVINYQFNFANEFQNGFAVVENDDKIGLIDKEGKYVINPQFEFMIHDGDNFLIKMNDKYGWCDKTGKININPQFSYAYCFKGDKLAAVRSGKDWGYIDVEGKIIINPQFDFALPFNGSHAAVVNGKSVGFIDQEGKFLINPQFDKLAPDYTTYLINGGTEYDRVQTDFFDIDLILKRINLENPEGLTQTSRISDVLTKLGLSRNDLNIYADEHKVITYREISASARYDFFIFANAKKTETKGWYNEQVFNPNAQISGFAYIVYLDGKGRGRYPDLKEAVEKSLSSFQRKDDETDQFQSIFRNNAKTVTIAVNNTRIVIAVRNELSEDTPSESNNAGSTATDDTH